MAIYTKRGDRGRTNSYSLKKLAKNSLKIQAIGAVDEVNSFLGVISSNNGLKLGGILKEVQKDLFAIGSILAGARLRFYATKTRKLEKQIDELEKILPPLKNFILPRGTLAGAQLHFARALARRAERAVVFLSKEEKVKSQILTYLNRLSDFLFMLARKANYDKGVEEEIWQGKR
ncbi:MAG: cob(I)yrinic acid a,c-diamide adenosyltransferase [Microgenomates group bacterium]